MLWPAAFETAGVATSISAGTVVVGPGTADTKGTYVELTASTSITTAWFKVLFNYAVSNVGTDDFLFDIATGAAASEVVLIANLIVSINGNRGNYADYSFPIAIASGTRLAARCQQSSTSTTQFLSVQLLLASSSTITGGSAVQTYGASTADSGGTSIDPGGSANTKGSYVELSASTSAELNFLAIGIGSQENTIRTSANWLIDVATGAAASEVVLIPDLTLGTSGGTDAFFANAWSMGVPTVSASTRLSARAACDITDATDRLIDLAVYGTNVATPSGGGGTGTGGALALGSSFALT